MTSGDYIIWTIIGENDYNLLTHFTKKKYNNKDNFNSVSRFDFFTIFLVSLSVKQFKIRHTKYVFVLILVVYILILKLKLFCETLRERCYQTKRMGW